MSYVDKIMLFSFLSLFVTNAPQLSPELPCPKEENTVGCSIPVD